jgi:hypothetical protein
MGEASTFGVVGHVEIRPTATRYVDGAWQGAQPVK